jgi:hypothetical protein
MRVRAETMRDAEARRMMCEIAMQYEDLAALIEKRGPAIRRATAGVS